MGSIDGYSHTEDNSDDGDQYSEDSSLSDCESEITGPGNQEPVVNSGLNVVQETERVYESIKNRLILNLTSKGFNVAQIMAIHRTGCTGIMSQARLHCFLLYTQAMEIKLGGNANVKHAWFGASKSEIDRTISYGFGIPMNSRSHGNGIYLSPLQHPIESLPEAEADDDGIRHMVLCRVVLGRTEIIPRGSTQCNPSSAEFDSGIDSLISPRRYIIWCSSMNSQILPQFVVSIRASSIVPRGIALNPQAPPTRPNSDWMPFASLISAISNYVPPDITWLIARFYRDFQNKVITRPELVQKVRHVVGDELLMEVIRKHSIAGDWGSNG